ncbi:MAG: GGDEF domain-containing protein, partial [Lachnospiraceae bacterium]|nr:GGDEF domain-containing protein [Lachnospiraceae bacterium]
MQETSRKRKIAVFANGWSIEALLRAAEGIRKYAEKEDFDTFVFLSYASYSEYESLNRGELNVYDLPRLQDYDGVIVFSTMLNSDETARKICEKAKKKNVPAVSIGMPIGEAPCVTVENEKGMRELVTHLIEVHDVKRIVFMGGTPDHVDSMARLHTTEEVLKEHGLRLDPEDVCYGNWGGVWPRELMRKLVETKELPDAVVCANDIMALSAAAELNLLGVDVPKDVIVTGFDEIAYGKDFYPALSTVAQNFEEVGYLCCERLFEMIEGRECPKMTAVSTSFVLGESCGCTSGHDYENYHRNYCRTSYQRHEDEASLEQTERVLRGEISGIPDYHALKRRLQAHYLRNHRYEGSSFYIVLHSEYFEDVTADEMELWEKVNTEKMEVIVAIRDGETVKDPEADRSQLIPNYVKEDGVQRIHYIVPLHYYEANYGYAIFSEDSFILRHDMMYPYLEKVQQSLKLLRINLRLDMVNRQLQQIYDRDPMTGLFNRLAYENRAQALFDECKKNGK